LRLVNVGVIGVGRMGLYHALNVSRGVAEARLIAVADVRLDLAKRVAQLTGAEAYYQDYQRLLEREDIDAVCIATPSVTHAKICIEAAEAGKDIFCEKPISVSLEEANKVIHAVKNAGVKFQVGFMRRFDPAYDYAKKKVDEGVIGKPLLFKSTSRDTSPPPDHACDPKTGGGLQLEMHIHDYDLGRWFMGSEVKRVYAEGDALVFGSKRKKIHEFVDNIVISLRFANRTLGLIEGSLNAKYGLDVRTEILGSEGAVMIGALGYTPVTVCTPSHGISEEVTFKGDPKVPHFVQRFHDAFVRELGHFVNCILNDLEPVVTAKDGVAALEVGLAAIRSTEEHKPVELPLKKG